MPCFSLKSEKQDNVTKRFSFYGDKRERSISIRTRKLEAMLQEAKSEGNLPRNRETLE